MFSASTILAMIVGASLNVPEAGKPAEVNNCTISGVVFYSDQKQGGLKVYFKKKDAKIRSYTRTNSKGFFCVSFSTKIGEIYEMGVHDPDSPALAVSTIEITTVPTWIDKRY